MGQPVRIALIEDDEPLRRFLLRVLASSVMRCRVVGRNSIRAPAARRVRT
jgi:hypothetical protein